MKHPTGVQPHMGTPNFIWLEQKLKLKDRSAIKVCQTLGCNCSTCMLLARGLRVAYISPWKSYLVLGYSYALVWSIDFWAVWIFDSVDLVGLFICSSFSFADMWSHLSIVTVKIFGRAHLIYHVQSLSKYPPRHFRFRLLRCLSLELGAASCKLIFRIQKE